MILNVKPPFQPRLFDIGLQSEAELIAFNEMLMVTHAANTKHPYTKQIVEALYSAANNGASISGGVPQEQEAPAATAQSAGDVAASPTTEVPENGSSTQE